ncbi:MAG: lipid-A-disaccharide synthase [Ignavibacteriales bacterium]|nr:lipid-A-disaccharide synthase [Ignavibacteriales bacterium]
MTKLMIVAGERSGDMHGANLLRELKRREPSLEAFGVGGDEMIAQGLDARFHIDDLAFLGFAEVVKHLPFIRKARRALVEAARSERIDGAVLIDYPGFNLSLAKKLAREGVPIHYYVSPQVWAWGVGRVKKIKRLVDKMLTTFPFEAEFYRKHGVEVEYVGNPLVERLADREPTPRRAFFDKYGLNESKRTLFVAPGSRRHEVETIFPIAIEGARRTARRFDMQILVAAASARLAERMREIAPTDDYRVAVGDSIDAMANADYGFVKSGTSTLEAALLGLPMTVMYKTSRLTYWIGSRLVKIDRIGMVNIVADEMIAPELIQNNLTPARLEEEAAKALSDDERLATTRKKLEIVRERLGEKRASENAAKSILEALGERSAR